jgi:hypothetical protein
MHRVNAEDRILRQARGPNRMLVALIAASGLGALVMAGAGCGGGGAGVDTASYETLVTNGWDAFRSGDFEGAAAQFNQAIAVDSTRADAWVGLGWTGVRNHDIAAADVAFTAGSHRAAADSLRADLFAGWAFATAALADTSGAGRDHYTRSNARADSALAIEPGWDFEFLPSIDHDDLRLLQAENHFVLGEFDASLAIVQLFEPLFTANTSTREGQAALSSEIEALTVAHLGLIRPR